MKEREATGSLLIVSSSEKSSRQIAALTDPALLSSVTMERTGSGARRLLTVRRFDLIVINAPLSDEFGHELAAALAGQTEAGVILLVKSDVYEEVSDMAGAAGVITVAKPLSGALFHQAVRMGLAVSARLSAAEREMARLKQKLEESRLVGRAKCLLIENHGISEAEAHRRIEKRAMDTRSSRQAVAEDILREYGS